MDDRIKIIFLSLLAWMLLAACTDVRREQAVLDIASQLLDTHPDSARWLLDSIQPQVEQRNVRSLTMRHRLLMAAALNKTNHQLPSDSVFMDVVRYYDRYGNNNEQMMAYYLLARIYSDMGDAPKALQNYHEAVNCADANAADCDYLLLSKVYSQMAYVFEQQEVYHDAIVCCQQASKYAMEAGDSVLAVLNYSLQANSYDNMLMADSVDTISLRSYKLFNKYGEKILAARSLSHYIFNAIQQGRLPDAEKYMTIYDKESGLFDSHGNSLVGNGVYDYYRGRYYLAKRKHSEALKYFRNCYSDHDLNQRKAFYLGMREFYKSTHQADSIAKYSELYADANDSTYIQLSTSTMQRMQSMYNYGRIARESEKMAQEKAHLIILLVVLSVVFIIIIVGAWMGFRFFKVKQRRKMLIVREKYFNDVRLLKEKRDELAQRNRELEESNRQSIDEKEREISRLETEIASYLSRHPETPLQLDIELKEAPIAKTLVSLREANKQPSFSEWLLLRHLLEEKIPNFFVILDETKYGISPQDMQICMLRRMGFQPKDIAVLTGTYEQKVTNTRSRLLARVFGRKEGGTKAFDEIIMSIQ